MPISADRIQFYFSYSQKISIIYTLTAMDSEKSPIANDISVLQTTSDDDDSAQGGTVRDQKDMYRLGKHQSLRVEILSQSR